MQSNKEPFLWWTLCGITWDVEQEASADGSFMHHAAIHTPRRIVDWGSFRVVAHVPPLKDPSASQSTEKQKLDSILSAARFVCSVNDLLSLPVVQDGPRGPRHLRKSRVLPQKVLCGCDMIGQARVAKVPMELYTPA
ncbi:hypothetical protein FI667_g8717, partial [Globisporangium splendens]